MDVVLAGLALIVLGAGLLVVLGVLCRRADPVRCRDCLGREDEGDHSACRWFAAEPPPDEASTTEYAPPPVVDRRPDVPKAATFFASPEQEARYLAFLDDQERRVLDDLARLPRPGQE